MTRHELLDHLNSVHSVFCLATLGSTLVCCEEVSRLISISTAHFGRYKIDFSQLLLFPKEKLVESIFFASKSSVRQLITEAFEPIKAYADSTGQTEVLKQQSWFYFARCIRNGFNHNFCLSFKASELKFMPLTWHSKSTPPETLTIDASMEGWPIDVVNRPHQKDRQYFQFTYEHALDLFYEMRASAEILA